ncbi:MAG TPA: class I SAM-dependent methyltransferase [Blastocatellia bacterium]|nr:class I SAM-dependent methyltransferase [Blastocatellia bacterium]
MKNLTNKDYWNTAYKKTGEEAEPRQMAASADSVRGIIKRYLGNYLRDYSDYLEWEVLYRSYFPKETRGLKVLEIGSAPGTNLVRLNQTFGFVPYGVEYSEAGVEVNRKVFERHGLDTGNVIYADFFSDTFQSEYREAFDIVISRGFIEHFTEVEGVIDKHISLLKDGGRLLISIPRLVGLNYLLCRLFNKDILPLHNLTIMHKQSFTDLFRNKPLIQEYCGYYGTLKFSVSLPGQRTGFRGWMINILLNAQLIMNLHFHLLLRDKGAESQLFSPYLLFIGTKKMGSGSNG